ncbi:MAG: HNH nuclease family protein [Magnetococcales bacterium]|nr:HNH nuclease family protein [Magnetococcales bacterium]MBF0321714.1 HNH nuclease family protein [Magnetococcales bacterium]
MIKTKSFGTLRPRQGQNRPEKGDAIVSEARQSRQAREAGYRDHSLRIHPWVCARCGRHFTRENLHELTVHHKDHNHDNNPPNGSNWENLCVYCHDNEHARYHDHLASGGQAAPVHETVASATHTPFAHLMDLLAKK